MRKLLYVLLAACCSTALAQAGTPATGDESPGAYNLRPNLRPIPEAQAPATIPVTEAPVASVSTTDPATSAPPVSSGAYVLDDKHKLLPGDKISFRILEDRDQPNDPPKTLTVTDSGELDLPYIGLTAATGKTCKQLADEVKPIYERDYYYVATLVIGLDSASKSIGRIYIWGQVKSQGPVEMPANEVFTTGKAILRAGGFLEFANKKKVKVIRGSGASKTTFELNMEKILEKGETDKDIILEPDDFIIVPQRLINIF